MSFKMHSPLKRQYKDYKCFDRTRFENNLNEKLSEGIMTMNHLELLWLKC